MKILGIETSCDETAACVIDTEAKIILSDIIYSQIKEHASYGGIVPDIAAKSHLYRIETIVQSALKDSGHTIESIDAIAVTSEPGLIGSILIGTMFAKGLAIAHKKPIYAINHLCAHSLVARMFNDVPFPYISLLISGGHTQLMLFESPVDTKVIGRTLDDSAGECFDKVARMLNLGYPGGPIIEKMALAGDPDAVPLTVPLRHDKSTNFSFSGLKTACMQYIKKNEGLCKHDLCASFQKTVALHLKERIQNVALDLPIIISGGVGANKYISQTLLETGKNIIITPMRYCSDNAAMVAWACHENIIHGCKPSQMDFKAIPS